MDNHGRIILDLCGGTGAWSRPYAKAGYDVRLVTLPEQDVLDYVPPANVHGILAAPPCTMFSLARTRAKVPRDYREGMKTVKACLEIVWQCQEGAGISWWALENPVGHLRKFLGRPEYRFSQWEFGDSGIKPTDLWGYFHAPKRAVKQKPEGLAERFPNGRFNAKGWSGSAEKRSVTSPGFAQAFFKANP